METYWSDEHCHRCGDFGRCYVRVWTARPKKSRCEYCMELPENAAMPSEASTSAFPRNKAAQAARNKAETFWEFAGRMSDEVAKWPEWKRRAADTALVDLPKKGRLSPEYNQSILGNKFPVEAFSVGGVPETEEFHNVRNTDK